LKKNTTVIYNIKVIKLSCSFVAVCVEGSFWDSVSEQCELCAVGSYQNQPYQQFCVSCKVGQITIDLTGTIAGAVTGALSQDQCVGE